MKTTILPKGSVKFANGEQVIEVLRCSEREKPEHAILARSPERPWWPRVHISVQENGGEAWTVFKGHPVQAGALGLAMEQFYVAPYGDGPPFKIWFGEHQVLLNSDSDLLLMVTFPSRVILHLASHEQAIFVHALKRLAELPVSGEAS